MKVFVNDTISLTLNTLKDVSSFTVFRIKYVDPDGNTGRWTASLHPSSNLKIRNTNIQFDSPGRWRVQAYVWKAGPEYYHGYWAEIKVYERLADTTTAAPTTAQPTTTAPTTLAPTT